VLPTLQAFNSLKEVPWTKTFVFLLAYFTSAQFNFDMFSTPTAWAQGLVVLVVLDWVSGFIVSLHRGNFRIENLADKWFQAFGYVVTCLAAAVISNVFGKLDFIQFFVYISFFLKEGASIAKNVGLKNQLVRMYKAMHPGKQSNNIVDALDHDPPKEKKDHDSMTYDENE